MYFGFGFAAASAGATGGIDNVSVKEVTPLAVSFGFKGLATYADTGTALENTYLAWTASSSERIEHRLDTSSTNTGLVNYLQSAGGVTEQVKSAGGVYSPGINVPISIASYHKENGVNGAVDGTALTEDTTPVAFPNLSATDISIATTFNGVIQQFVMWSEDIGDGIEETSL